MNIGQETARTAMRLSHKLTDVTHKFDDLRSELSRLGEYDDEHDSTHQDAAARKYYYDYIMPVMNAMNDFYCSFNNDRDCVGMNPALWEQLENIIKHGGSQDELFYITGEIQCRFLSRTVHGIATKKD
jgi:hypothetical protein